MTHNVQSNTAKFFIIIVNGKGIMVRRFLDRHQETPKHVAFLIDVKNQEFGC
jgi:hypothetical protein